MNFHSQDLKNKMQIQGKHEVKGKSLLQFNIIMAIWLGPCKNVLIHKKCTALYT
jgi:hypothetical protein